MPVVWRLPFLFCVFFVITSLFATSVPEKESEKVKDESPDTDEEESSAKEKGTTSPEVKKELEEKIIEIEEKNAEKFGVPVTVKPEDVETYLEVEEKIYGSELPEVVENKLDEIKTGDNLTQFVNFIDLFNEVKVAGSINEDESVKKTPEEMKKLKEETFTLMNKLDKKTGLPEMSREMFDEMWNEKKKEHGDNFPQVAEKTAINLQETIDRMDAKAAETTTEVSETGITTESADILKEELPQGTFALRNAKGNICILAKFHSLITITYPGKSSDLKVEVSIPHSGHTKGKCRGPHGSALLQIAWEKFVFSLHFNKTTEEEWGATLVELAYDTSEPLFDGAAEREKITAKSKIVNLFQTPYKKSYFCPAQEVILLYREDQHVATVRLKEIHLQPYDVEDGKFSPSNRCSQVVIGGPDEEPFVQDETVPLAVGCTLALITLLILVGFSVHRAYNAAKVDYNTVE